jgi:ketosteroid isomerase-like protein
VSGDPAANRTVLERYAAAWLAGDLPGIIGSYHDEFILHYHGTSDLAGTYVGKEASLRALVEFSQRSERRLVEVTDILVGQTGGALLVRESLGAGDMRFETDRVLVYRVRADLLAECWVYDTDTARVDGVLGSELGGVHAPRPRF